MTTIKYLDVRRYTAAVSQIAGLEGGDDNNKISCLYRIGPLTGSPEILTPQRVVTISGGEVGGGGVEVV